jgi:hypothetical protein
MSPKLLAQELLPFRMSASLLVPNSVTARLGPDAVQDALQRGWLQPDMDSGFLCLAPEAGKLAEMEQAASGPETTPSHKTEALDFRGPALRHALREASYGVGMGASTSGSMGSGQPERPAPMPPRTNTTFGDRQHHPGDFVVGEDVMIADQGKTYQAKIRTRRPDGTYELSFGPNIPLRSDRTFRREEMRAMDPGSAGAPSPTAAPTSAPAR